MKTAFWIAWLASLLLVAAATAAPLGTAFTYQGSLEQDGVPAQGAFDFQVALFNAASGGTAIDTEAFNNRVVDAGVFTLDLDFTDAPFLDGEAMFLELRVRPAGSGSFTTLSPRQAVRAVPYALRALRSADAGGPAASLVRPSFVERPIPLGAGRTAGDASLVTGRDGLPFIAVHDSANGDLLAVHCHDITCEASTITVVDAANQVGDDVSVILNRNGMPVIGYYDATHGDLRVAFCADFGCTSATLATVDSVGDVGREVFAIRSRFGSPNFFYYDATNGDLKVIACSDTSCTSAPVLVDSAGDVGRGVAAAYSGFRLYVTYHDQGTGRLLLKVCSTGPATCNTPPVVVVDGIADSGDSSAVLVPADGLPLIVYTRGTSVRAARCTTLACAAVQATANALTSGVTRVAPIIGADGMPYVLATAADNRARVRCGSFDCSNVVPVLSGGLASTVDGKPSAAMGGHGLPQFAHRHGADLRLVTCGHHDCDASTRL